MEYFVWGTRSFRLNRDLYRAKELRKTAGTKGSLMYIFNPHDYVSVGNNRQ